MSIDETYTLAHTAQCKLKMAADRPNRDLRFILGHAFTLDKVMCRIVEIENEQESVPKADYRGQENSCVTFKDDRSAPLRREMNSSTQKGAKRGRARSPPPEPNAADMDSSDSDEYAFDEDEDADDPSLSLSKTTSRIAQQPPNLIPSDGDSSDEDDDDGPVSPPSKPSDSVLETIIEEDGDETLAELYDGIRRCGCQNDVDKKAPPVAKVWELPQSEVKKSGKGMKPTRKLLVQVQA